MRATQHLGLRLRDQLLAFASVCALKLDPGQLAPLGHTFDNLASLSLSGKVSLDGQLLRELTTAFSSNSNSSRGGCSSSSRKGLQSLFLDVHFVGVGAQDVAAALQAMTQLKVGTDHGGLLKWRAGTLADVCSGSLIMTLHEAPTWVWTLVTEVGVSVLSSS